MNIVRFISNGFARNVEDCSEKFGVILGFHKTIFAASKEVGKSSDQDFVEFDTPFKAKVGERHVDVFHALVSKKRYESQVATCAKLIEAMKSSSQSSIEELTKDVSLENEFGESLSVDDWFEYFSPGAEKLIAETQSLKQEEAKKLAQKKSVAKGFNKIAEEITYSFPAVRGIQAKKEFFVAQVPFKYLVKFFTFVDESLPAEERAQRKVNVKHANELAQYVLENREDYVLPALTVSVSSAMEFDFLDVEGLASTLGVLKIPLISQLLINDGQHRRYGSEVFIQLDETLGDETIAVCFYYDEGLQRSKQMFADLNSNLSKPNSAISSLYDVRNKLNNFVLKALARHCIDRFTDKENTSINSTSEFIWSLVHWKKFITVLFSIKESSFDNEDFNEEYHNEVFDLVIETLLLNQTLWCDVIDDMNPTFKSSDLRSDFISGHAVYLESLAYTLNNVLPNDQMLTEKYRSILVKSIESISQLPVDKSAEVWNGVCVNGKRMVKSADSVKLTSAIMSTQAGIPLNNSMLEVLNRYNINAEDKVS